MKFYGKLGYAITYEKNPGVWMESFLEIEAYGDFIQNTYGLKGSNKVNDDVNALYIISVVVDSYAIDNLQFLKYVYYKNVTWKVHRAKLEYPRLIITLTGDPFEVSSKISTNKREADDYVNNYIVNNMPSLNCKLVPDKYKKNQENLEITFEPVTDPVLLYYINYKKTILRAQLLIHSAGNWYQHNDNGLSISIPLTSTNRKHDERSTFVRSRVNNKSFYGISHINLSESDLKNGKVTLKNILSVSNFGSHNGVIRGRYDNNYIKPEQNFACELYVFCTEHSPDFNSYADILYYELQEFRRLSDNTVTKKF